jgi:predicted alpha/beta-hydrolase family hydrolase
MAQSRSVKIEIETGRSVDALVDAPAAKVAADRAFILMAHGAGNDMHEDLLAYLARGLADRGYGVLRFNFPYRSEGRQRPDSQRVLERTWMAVAAWARNQGGIATGRLLAGGKSMGARVASQLGGTGQLVVEGFLFWGYPLHAPGKTHQLRDKHLDAIAAPMLFVAGTRDPFCHLDFMRPVIKRLGKRASLEIIADGDHSFKVPRSSGKSQVRVYADILERSLRWIAAL